MSAMSSLFCENIGASVNVASHDERLLFAEDEFSEQTNAQKKNRTPRRKIAPN